MSEFIVEQQPLPDPNNFYNQGKSEFSDIRELKVGQGSTVFYTDKEGSRWGNIVLADANAWIRMDGTAKFKTSGGTTILDTGATDGNYLQVINTALNTASKKILDDFTFESTDYAGAFKSGNITWSTTTGLVTGGTGIVINDRGIIGAASGVTTFTIDSTTGNATFAGTLVAASGTLGSITIGSNAWHVDSNGNMWWGNFASYAAAAIKISNTGSVDFSTGNIIGATIKATSATTGANVFLDPSNKRISFLYDNSEKAFIFSDSSGNLVIDADNLIYLTADGAGDDIIITAADIVFLDGGSVFLNATGDVAVSEADNIIMYFNSDNNNDNCDWIDDAAGDTLMTLDSSDENLYIDGSFIDTGADFAEFFEATEEFSKEKIPVGTSVVLEGEKIRPAVAGETPFGVISVNPTIVGNSGGTSSGKQWGGKYLKDEFGKYIMEEAEFWRKEIKEKVDKGNGKVRENKKRISGFSDREVPPKGAKIKKVMRKKLNPDWDGDKEYIPRSKRPEWNIVGLVGRLRLRTGQPVAPSWLKIKTISPTVEEWLIR